MYNSLVNGLCHDDRFPEPMKWLKVMFGEGLVPDLIVYTSVIASYCRRSNMQAAMEVFGAMKRSGLSPDAFVYTCLISGYSKVLAMDGARLMMEEMVEGYCTYCSNLCNIYSWIL
jgi:pentatricopeptide repeat protein